MSRFAVTLRPARSSDAPVLASLWSDQLRRGSVEDQVADCLTAVAHAEADPDRRLLVAELDGELAGAVLLVATTASALNLEPVVSVISPRVFDRFRRHGVGSALVEAGVQFADELGVAHLGVAATAGSRDANRFMARLSLAPVAMWRVSTTAAVRSRLSAVRPSPSRTATPAVNRQIDRVLAARRLRRRDEVPS